jgi:hypothetical protein
LSGDADGDVTAEAPRTFHNKWLGLMGWPVGGDDPALVLERVFPDNLSQRLAGEKLSDTLVWAYIRELRLLERDEVIYLQYGSTAGCFVPGTRRRDPEFFQGNTPGTLAGKKGQGKKMAKTPKGDHDPVVAIVKAAIDNKRPFQCQSGRFFAVGAFSQNIPATAPPKPARKARTAKNPAAVDVSALSLLDTSMNTSTASSSGKKFILIII